MKRFKKTLSLLLAVVIILTTVFTFSAVTASAATATITYTFTNNTAGYAQGTVKVAPTSGNFGTYYLYWADDTKALEDYAEITSLSISSGTGTFTFPEYTAIPADATKLIAIKATSEPAEANRTVAKASAVYNIPTSKQLAADTEDALYTFGAISDPQLANDSYGSGSYPYDETHFKAALETLADRNVNFTISSGDTVNDQNGSQTYAAEFIRYQRLLADSSYCNPIYEANGNHDVGTVWDKNGNYYNNNVPFVKGTGLNSVKTTINAGKPYFEITEPTTGDHFIFMALEGGFYTNKGTQFSTAQLDWLEGLLKKYNNDGKNIFIIEHANIGGWGAGDKLTEPYYYDLALIKSNPDVSRFVKLMETYKDCVIITGHTHLELSAQYNYSDNDGTSAVMIHNSAIGGVRRLVNGAIDRSAVLGLSEGYIIEVYEDYILFNGTNLYYNETMPQCCYIVPMGTSLSDNENPTTPDDSEDTVTITLRDMTGEGWMKNNAAEREIQLIDNDTNTKYIMTSYDSYKTWTAEVPRSVTDITFKRVRMSDNVDRNIWYAGQRNGSLEWCVLDQVEEVTGIGYWNTSVTEPPVIPTTAPETTVKTDPSIATDPADTTEATVASTSASDPVESTTATSPSQSTETTESTEATTAATEASSSTENTPVATESTPSTTKGTPAATETTAAITESIPADTEYMYGDADLDGKVNVKDATTIQKATAKMITLDEVQTVQSDVTADGTVNIKDATSIQKYAAKLIDKFPAEEKTVMLVSVGATSLDSVAQDLEDYYTFSSYDQYMALKKAYLKYKGTTLTTAEQTELTKLQNALYDIAGERPGESGNEITVYFSNNEYWSTVNAYVWGSGGTLKDWPGTAMTFVRQNSQGEDIYSFTLDYSLYQNIIFTDGSSQTADIALDGTDNVGYYLDGTDSSGKYTVKTYTYS